MIRLLFAPAAIFLMAAVPASYAASGEGERPARSGEVRPVRSGEVRPDSTARSGEVRAAMLYGGIQADRGANHFPTRTTTGTRSVPLALGLSAVLPGAGQAYNGNWIKAAVALALEGALLGGYINWRARGMQGEEDYQEYAHGFWSADRYASWINDYVVYLNEEHGASIGAGPVQAPGGIDFSAPSTWSSQESAAVREFFDRIRAVESVLFHPETGASFSHKLPYFGEQQYYELIGKYFVFAPGWVDYPSWKEGDGFTQAIDPARTGPGGERINVKGRFFEYASDHADANTLLRHASRVTSFVVLNHFLAAIDAAISAKLHNDRLDAGMRLGYDAMNRPQMLASVRWTF